MRAYTLRRLLQLIPTLIGISLLAFGLARLAPGDPAVAYLTGALDHQPTLEEIAFTRHELGLDRPLHVQYLSWLSKAARGDLGISYASRRPVILDLKRRIPFTMELAVPAALLTIAIALPVGLVSALYRNRPADQAARIVTLAGASMPSFWLALLLIILFAVKLNWVPVAGRQGSISGILPTFALALTPSAILARFTRSTMLETLGEDYIRTARAKGLREALVVGRHVLRNGLVPVITAFGTSLGHMLAGAVVIESIFVWPGLGKMALDAVLQRDLPTIQAVVLFSGAVFVIINLIVDLSYAVLDPRIRLANVGEGAS